MKGTPPQWGPLHLLLLRRLLGGEGLSGTCDGLGVEVPRGVLLLLVACVVLAQPSAELLPRDLEFLRKFLGTLPRRSLRSRRLHLRLGLRLGRRRLGLHDLGLLLLLNRLLQLLLKVGLHIVHLLRA